MSAVVPQSSDKIVKVVFLYKLFHTVKAYLEDKFEKFPNIQLIFPEDTSEENLIQIVPAADILVTWNTSEPILNAATSLKLLLSPYTGIDHLSRTIRNIGEKKNKKKSFLVANAHGVSRLIAQQAVAMLLAITNHIVPHHHRLSEGVWIPG